MRTIRLLAIACTLACAATLSTACVSNPTPHPGTEDPTGIQAGGEAGPAAPTQPGGPQPSREDFDDNLGGVADASVAMPEASEDAWAPSEPDAGPDIFEPDDILDVHDDVEPSTDTHPVPAEDDIWDPDAVEDDTDGDEAD